MTAALRQRRCSAFRLRGRIRGTGRTRCASNIKTCPRTGPQIEFHRDSPTAGPSHVQTRPKRRDLGSPTPRKTPARDVPARAQPKRASANQSLTPPFSACPCNWPKCISRRPRPSVLRKLRLRLRSSPGLFNKSRVHRSASLRVTQLAGLGPLDGERRITTPSRNIAAG